MDQKILDPKKCRLKNTTWQLRLLMRPPHLYPTPLHYPTPCTTLNLTVPWTTLGPYLACMTLDHPKPICI